MDKLLNAMLEAAIRAPSGDNCQPWRFAVMEEGVVEIYLDSDSANSFFDLDYRASCISVGAVVENMRVAAAAAGRGLRVEYSGKLDLEKAVARVWLEDMQPGLHADVAFLHDALYRRTVNRRPFLPGRLPEAVWRRLQASLSVDDDIAVVPYLDPVDRRQWLKAIRAADLIRWTHQAIHQELFNKIRLSRQEAMRERTGLEIDRLGAGPGASQVMRFLRSWTRMSYLNRLGGAHFLAAQTAMLVKASAGLIGVWVKDDVPEQWMKAGESIERLWNMAAHLGWQVQPLPVALYLERRYRLTGMRDYAASHQTHLENISAIIKTYQARQPPHVTGVMLFRIGRGAAMKQTAVRRPLEHFLLRA